MTGFVVMVAQTGPSISVVVPLFNGEEFIRGALESIARQTLPVSEVIVVDDGSSDNGPEIAETAELTVTVIRQSRAGVAVARNRGLARASGEFVAFLDQDDFWHPARLEMVRDVLVRDRAVLTGEQTFATIEDTRFGWDADGLHLDARLPESELAEQLLVKNALPLRSTPVTRTVDHYELLRSPIAHTTSCIVERELAIAAGGFPTHARSVDDYLFMQNVSRVHPFTLIDHGSHLYRVRPTSTYRSAPNSLPLLAGVVGSRFGGNLVSLDMVDGLGNQPHIDYSVGQLIADPTTLDLTRRMAVAYLALPRGRRRRLPRLAARPILRRSQLGASKPI